MNEYYKEAHQEFCNSSQEKKVGLKNLGNVSKDEMDEILG